MEEARTSAGALWRCHRARCEWVRRRIHGGGWIDGPHDGERDGRRRLGTALAATDGGGGGERAAALGVEAWGTREMEKRERRAVMLK